MPAPETRGITEREIAQRTRDRVQQRVSRRIHARPPAAGNAHGTVDEQIERMVGQEANATPDAPGRTEDGDGLTNDQIRDAMEGRRQELYLKGIADRASGARRAPGDDPVRAKTRELLAKHYGSPLQPDGGPAGPRERPRSAHLVFRDFERRRQREQGRAQERG